MSKRKNDKAPGPPYTYPAVRAIADHVQRRVDELGSQEKVAELFGGHQKDVSRLVNCRTNPTLDRVEAVANALGMDIWDFVRPIPKKGDSSVTRAFAIKALVDEVESGLSDEELIQVIDTVKNAVKMKKQRVATNDDHAKAGVYFNVDRRKQDEPTNKNRRNSQGWNIQNPADPSDYIQSQNSSSQEAPAGPEMGK